MRERMRVLEVDGNNAKLVPEEVGESCHACPLEKICKGGEKALKVRVEGIELKEGDLVEVEIPRSVSTRLSLLVYTLPLLIFISSLVVFKSFGMGDLPSFLISIGVLGVYYVALKKHDSKIARKYAPRIVRKI